MHHFWSPSKLWNSLIINTVESYLFIDLLLRVSDWVDGLIGPTGLLLLVSHLLVVPVGFGTKKLVTKTWM
jgi:hypothetical protein